MVTQVRFGDISSNHFSTNFQQNYSFRSLLYGLPWYTDLGNIRWPLLLKLPGDFSSLWLIEEVQWAHLVV